MTEKKFKELTMAEKGLIIMKSGKHLMQMKQGSYLLNLYSLHDFFVEVYYSINNNKVDKIELINDLSRVDMYIDEKIKSSHSN